MVTVLWNIDEERGAAVKQGNSSTKHQRFAKCFAYITSSNPSNNLGRLKVECL